MNTSPSLQVTVIYNPEEKSTTDEVALTDSGIQTTASTIANTLRQCGYETSIYPVSEKNLYYLKHKKTDAFFNVCEASDLYMRVVKQLEKGGRVFTGPGPTVMALTVDKIATKRVFESIHVPTPAWQIFETGKEKLQSNLQFPLIVKPANEDCSIGITQQSIVREEASLYARIQEIRGIYKQRVLVEEFIGGKELHCTVLGNGKDAVVLPLAELQFNDGHEDPEFIFDYEAKWVESSPNFQNTFVSPAPSVDERITKAIQRDAKRAFVALEMKDYARFDVRLNQKTGKWYFLEANANPSIQPRDEATTTSASAVGMGYHQFIQTIVESCTKRHAYAPLVATN
jgi:D-alanine-D-alanine ligase